MLAAVILGFWIWISPDADRITMYPAKIENVKQMVRLSAMQIYEEVPVKGKVGNRHLVAKLALEGSIDFDLDNLKFEEYGDTVRVTLPPEIVTLREHTSWFVCGYRHMERQFLWIRQYFGQRGKQNESTYHGECRKAGLCPRLCASGTCRCRKFGKVSSLRRSSRKDGNSG